MKQFSVSSVGKALGILALVFFSGFATGLLSSNLLPYLSPRPSENLLIEATLAELSGQLGLNPSQLEQIRVILDDVIMEEAELLSELEWNQIEARQRISNYLTAEQNEIFNRIIEASLERR